VEVIDVDDACNPSGSPAQEEDMNSLNDWQDVCSGPSKPNRSDARTSFPSPGTCTSTGEVETGYQHLRYTNTASPTKVPEEDFELEGAYSNKIPVRHCFLSVFTFNNLNIAGKVA
jgi:hypothetical protein